MEVGAVLLYMAGLSYREITYVLRFVPCSREAVRLWVKKLERVTVKVGIKPRTPQGFIGALISPLSGRALSKPSLARRRALGLE